MRLAPLALAVALALATAPAAVGHAAPSPADEQAKQAALPWAKKGLELFDAGKFKEAVAQFERAEALYHAPTHLLFIAQAHEQLGQLLEAQERYQQLADEQLPEGTSEAFRNAQATAREALARLPSRIPSVAVEVRGIDREQVTLTVDGKPRPDWSGQALELNPGEHELVVSAEGIEPVSRSVTLTEGQREQVEIVVSPPQPEPVAEPVEVEDGSFLPAIVAFGVGGAGLLIGTITGVVSLNKVSELEESCPTKQCSPEDEPLGSEAETLGNVSTVSFVVGGAAIAAGAVLLFWRPFGGGEPAEAALQVRPRVGLGSLHLEATF